MKKQFLVLAITSSLACSAHAEWIGGVGYTNLSDSEDGIDVSLSAVTASAGYAFELGENTTLTPELRLGFGLGSDTLDVFGIPADVKLNKLVAFSLRAQFDYANGIYLFAQPSYANLDLEVSSMGFAATDDAWEFGIGGGVGYRFSDKVGGELGYESFDGSNVVSAGLRFRF